MAEKPQIPSEFLEIILSISKEKWSPYEYELKETEPGKKILALSLEDQRRFAFAALDWCQYHTKQYENPYWRVKEAVNALLKKNLEFSADEVCALMTRLLEFFRDPKIAMKIAEAFAKKNTLTPELQKLLKKLMKEVGPNPHNPDYKGIYARVQSLLGGPESLQLPLVEG